MRNSSLTPYKASVERAIKKDVKLANEIGLPSGGSRIGRNKFSKKIRAKHNKKTKSKVYSKSVRSFIRKYVHRAG
jgi:hypothetical protein